VAVGCEAVVWPEAVTKFPTTNPRRITETKVIRLITSPVLMDN
jgi:hypothetical protein